MATNTQQFNFIRSANRFTAHPTLGKLRFVDSVVAAANSLGANGGYHPDGPADLIATAQALCDASKGDIIFIAGEHGEAISGAAGLTLSKDGVTLQGLGNGRNRPTITFNTAIGAQMVISGAHITIRNMIFDFTGFSQITAAISVTGAYVAFEDCEFIMSTGTNAPVLGILTAATATGFRVERCRFLGPATSTDTVTACIKHEVGINFVFKDNYFIGKYTQAILNATAILGGLIDGNRAQIYTGTKAFSLHASTTGYGCNNRIVVPSGTAPVVGAGFTWGGGNIYGTEALTIGTPTAAAF